MRGKGEGSIIRVPADRSKPLKYWQVTVELPNHTGRPQDRRRKVARSKDKPTALKKLASMKEELRLRGDLPTSSITVEQWFTYWLDEVVASGTRPKTAGGYRSTTMKHIIPGLGAKTKLDKITPQTVRRVHDRIIESGLTSTYALNAHRIMARSFEIALREGRIGRNPARLLDAPRKSTKDLDVLNLEEAIHLLEVLSTRPDGARWATSLLTAGRRGEVIGLENDRVTDVIDVSWQLQRLPLSGGKLVVPADYEYRHVHGGLYFTRPKSRAGWRIIPLVDPLASILQKHMEEMPENEYGLLFTDPTGRPRDPDWDTKQWRDLLGSVFGQDRRVRLHDLRHTTVDLLYAAGVPEDIIVEIVGHSIRSMTRAYKSRSDIQRLRDAMALFSAPFMQLEPGRTREIGA